MTVTLESLSDSRNTLARLCLLAVKAADKTWKGVDPRRVRDSWNRTNADFLTLFATLQTRAASDAMDSSTLMLAEQATTCALTVLRIPSPSGRVSHRAASTSNHISISR